MIVSITSSLDLLSQSPKDHLQLICINWSIHNTNPLHSPLIIKCSIWFKSSNLEIKTWLISSKSLRLSLSLFQIVLYVHSYFSFNLLDAIEEEELHLLEEALSRHNKIIESSIIWKWTSIWNFHAYKINNVHASSIQNVHVEK